MIKREWDGNFNASRYVETGNLVNNVIENDGRILHESTIDGYTHEIVDRGTYISEDYYFPRRERGKKPHIHYEICSTGDIKIDGKKIITKTSGGMSKMKHMRALSKNHGLDGTVIKNEAGNLIEKADKFHELGKKFETDKARLEEAIEKIQNSAISDPDKKILINQLNANIEILKEQYECNVTAEEQKIQQRLIEQTESMQEAADELEQRANDLRGIKMEAASVDTTAVADAAEEQKQVFERMKEEYVEKLNLQIEQAAIQRRNIQNRKLSGR